MLINMDSMLRNILAIYGKCELNPYSLACDSSNMCPCAVH
jgi:hypothetical protein